MTTFYVSHGSPMQAFENTPAADFLREFSNLHIHERWTNFSLHPNRCQGSFIKNSSRCCCSDVVPDPWKKIAETFWLLRRWFVVGWFFWTLENGITHCCAGPKRLLQSPDIGTQRCRRWLWRGGIAQSTISMAFQRSFMRYIPTYCALTSSRAPFAWEEHVLPCLLFLFLHFRRIYLLHTLVIVDGDDTHVWNPWHFIVFWVVILQLEYTAPGAPELAKRVKELLLKAGFKTVVEDNKRGLDHGAWIPLMLMYPEADIPVIQLSVQSSKDGAHHYKLGRALASLKDEGYLILGSGTTTHNLRQVDSNATGVELWAKEFDQWLYESLINKRFGSDSSWAKPIFSCGLFYVFCEQTILAWIELQKTILWIFFLWLLWTKRQCGMHWANQIIDQFTLCLCEQTT